MTAIRFEIPIKPIPKGRPRLGTGRVYTPKRTKDFEEQVRFMARAAFNAHGVKPFDKAVYVYALFCFKGKQGGDNYTSTSDIDNLQKSLFDGLNGVAYKDDRQIVFVRARKQWAKQDGISVVIADEEQV